MRYAAVECQVAAVGGQRRYVRLHEEPKPLSECLDWLLAEGFVKRVPFMCTAADCDHEHCEDTRLIGWGSTYFMVPWEKSVSR